MTNIDSAVPDGTEAPPVEAVPRTTARVAGVHRTALTEKSLRNWPNDQGKLVLDSAISMEVATARGYDLLHREPDARALGFSHRASERVVDAHQALLVPIWDVASPDVTKPSGYQIRPTRAGRPTAVGKPAPKYETPPGQPNMLDSNPLMREMVVDSTCELWVTEGARKVDALASQGVPCVGLTGVWNWRGKEIPGDRDSFSVPLPQWEVVPLKDREIVVCFDSDAATNESVSSARKQLAAFLGAKGATVRYAVVPAAADGSKQGVDDYLGTGAALSALEVVGADTTAADVEAEAKRIRTREYLAKRRARGAGISGHELVSRVVAKLRKYVAMPSGEDTGDAYLVTALWVLHTHLVMKFDSTPRIAFLAPEKQSGKTRALEVIEPMVRKADRFFNASEAVMFRTIEQGYDTYEHVTLLIDETDAIFPQTRAAKADPAKESLRAIINAGHRKGSEVKRVEVQGKQMVLKSFPVYAPMALAGIGFLPETVMDRSIVVRMRRRRKDEKVCPLRMRDREAELVPIRTDIEDWVMAHEREFEGYYPEMPDGVEDRAADVWEALLAVADKTGRGREARAACRDFLRAEENLGSTASEGEQLLSNIRDVLQAIAPEPPESPESDVFVGSEQLTEMLRALPDGRWGEWCTTRWVGGQLRAYGIEGRKKWVDGSQVRGYFRSDFRDAWSRYLASRDACRSGDNPAEPRSVPSLVTPVTLVTRPGGETGSDAQSPSDTHMQCSRSSDSATAPLQVHEGGEGGEQAELREPASSPHHASQASRDEPVDWDHVVRLHELGA